MKRLENPFGQLPVNSRNPAQFFNTSLANALDTTKMGQQRAAAARPYTRYVFEHRMNGSLLAATTVTGDGKAVRLIPYLLYQV